MNGFEESCGHTARSWDMQPMAYDTFIESLTERKGNDWKQLMDANLIIGGIDRTSDPLSVLKSYLPLYISLFFIQRIGRLTASKFNRAFPSLLDLSKSKVLWPNPAENLVIASKIDYLRDLAIIASSLGTHTLMSSSTPRPTSTSIRVSSSSAASATKLNTS
ncbi:hypothetical protein C0989_011699 [Termitomyces sp. Mn162]|nr:hypothetical protein C0989_011699 [Termitomyces sp. Mn162]